MALLAATQSILEEVEKQTHVPFQILTESGLPVPARVLMARDQMRAHLVRVKQAYRILLTRAIKGLCVWVQDAETAAHLGDMLSTAV